MKRALFLSFLLFSILEAKYSPELKKWTASQHPPQFSAEKHFAFAEQLLNEHKWKEAQAHLIPIVEYFPEFAHYNNSVYYLAYCYYIQADLDLSNRYLSQYLGLKGDLPFFEKALQLKFQIAEMYRTNRHRHLFARKWLPTLFGSKDAAMAIYDEVIASLSNKEIAIQALFQKGIILKKRKEFEESVEVFKTLARRYEVHELAEQSFLQISEVYLARSLHESQNPDLLDLAQLNFVAFQKAFPSSPLRDQVLGNVLAMKEEFAKSLYATARFYQRKTKHQAARIYFDELLTKFPDTEVAKNCREKVLMH